MEAVYDVFLTVTGMFLVEPKDALGLGGSPYHPRLTQGDAGFDRPGHGKLTKVRLVGLEVRPADPDASVSKYVQSFSKQSYGQSTVCLERTKHKAIFLMSLANGTYSKGIYMQAWRRYISEDWYHHCCA